MKIPRGAADGGGALRRPPALAKERPLSWNRQCRWQQVTVDGSSGKIDVQP
jgi:hypothetical protein